MPVLHQRPSHGSATTRAARAQLQASVDVAMARYRPEAEGVFVLQHVTVPDGLGRVQLFVHHLGWRPDLGEVGWRAQARRARPAEVAERLVAAGWTVRTALPNAPEWPDGALTRSSHEGTQ